MELEKIEFQGLELDPTKTYIVNLHFDKDCSVEARYSLFKHYKQEFESRGFTNIIFNPYTDKCELDVLKAEEEKDETII